MIGALLSRGAEGFWSPTLSRAELAHVPPHLHCPIERLARGPHLLARERADWLLRARMYGLEPLNPSGWGLVKVAAKRYSAVSADELTERHATLLQEGVSFTEVGAPPPAIVTSLSQPAFPSLSVAGRWLLARAAAHNHELTQRGAGQEGGLLWREGASRRWSGARRAVGALLLDGALTPWALSFKQPERHALYHAEWALLDALLRAQPQLEGPLTLLSTLKPCKLCAGAWVSYGPRPLSVYYLSDDPGKMGQNTALDVGSFAWCEAGSLVERCDQAPLNV